MRSFLARTIFHKDAAIVSASRSPEPAAPDEPRAWYHAANARSAIALPKDFRNAVNFRMSPLLNFLTRITRRLPRGIVFLIAKLYRDNCYCFRRDKSTIHRRIAAERSGNRPALANAIIRK